MRVVARIISIAGLAYIVCGLGTLLMFADDCVTPEHKYNNDQWYACGYLASSLNPFTVIHSIFNHFYQYNPFAC